MNKDNKNTPCRVIRTYRGTAGYKFFETEAAADEYLNSEEVRLDKEDGIFFEKVVEKN